jgi:diguanylate cyclase (GGDEF)-like protein/PAS domain S-box-containing protein
MTDECLKMMEVLRHAFTARAPEETLPAEFAGEVELQTFHAELLEMRRFILAVAQGDLGRTLAVRGFTAGALKSLQASLKHMTWQTQRIASGDFSQRLDFMGDFSLAFNSMAEQLEKSVRTILEKEEELERRNASLQREIVERERMQTALAEREAHYRTITESMQDVVWILDSETLRFLYVSPSVKGLRGYTPEEVVGSHLDDSLTPQSATAARHRILEHRLLFLSGSEPADTFHTTEVEERCKDGSTVWTEAIARYRHNERTASVEIHGVSRNITERRALRLQLEQQATRDDLTGTFNRRHFLVTAEQEIRRARRSGHSFCVAMLDIDHFKTINDTFGHAMGDLALQEMAAACSKSLRDADFIGRLGGEEFAIALIDTELRQGLLVAERIRCKIERLSIVDDGGEPVPLRVSVGVAELATPEGSLEDVLALADQALYRAKNGGRNRVEGGEQGGNMALSALLPEPSRNKQERLADQSAGLGRRHQPPGLGG